jgi:hypothetical protein
MDLPEMVEDVIPNISDLYDEKEVVALLLSNGEVVQVDQGSYNELVAKDKDGIEVEIYRAYAGRSVIIGLQSSVIALISEPSDSE